MIAPLLATLLAMAVFAGDIGDATYCFMLMQMELVMSDCHEDHEEVQAGLTCYLLPYLPHLAALPLSNTSPQSCPVNLCPEG